ncbi:MAG: photosynthetic complex putative assembly protein PuhB [Ramlibacter sp.]|jgi:hypothetical protein|uniref:photosynthetic complex putative assembly protein PuhB n=1 Tax=Ramlibacter sp. TaxID=1917967 RepID=UPI00260DE4CC|nr:photosynthetic complex putative assembly protein PuhB [Ramlibacter sp.]MDH4374950.1 photosynthetic complex putative assembly protein PuhB [Ramlibacter sp.]
MTPHHEHEFEAAPGLPEPLPPGERILWQGAPDWRVLALHAYHLRQLAGYFGVMMAIQALYHWDAPAGTLLSSLALSAALAGTALGLLALGAWLSARTTLYTLTTRRVVMRIGIVLTITLNVPLRQLRGADLLAHPSGVGDLSLALAGKERIGWLHLWPHARPWHLADPQPTLRCIPNAAAVGEQVVAAWQAVQSMPASATQDAVSGVSPAAARPTLSSAGTTHTVTA